MSDLDILMPPPKAEKPLAAASARLRAAGKKPRLAKGVPSITEFCRDWLGIRPTPAQTVMLKVTFGEPLGEGELPLFRQLTGRAVDPRRRFPNASAVAGARGGKSGFYAAPSALYRAVFGGDVPARGERLRVGIFAQDSEAAGTLFDYLTEYIEQSPQLRERLVGRPLRRRLVVRSMLGHDVEVRCFPCTSKAARSYSFICVVLDEVAFYRYTAGAANQDVEIEASVRRGMLNVADPLFIKISTPAGKDGILYRDLRDHYGRDDALDLVVFKAPSIIMNPGISADRLAEEQRLLDPAVYEREFEAEFMDAAGAWLPRALVDAAVDQGVAERPRVPGATYVAAIDPSGGAGCAFAFAVGHAEERGGRRTFVVDCVRRWMKPRDGQLDLDATVAQAVGLCAGYGVTSVYSDRYGGQWPAQAFSRLSEGKVALLDPVLLRRDGGEAFQHKSDAFVEAGPYFRSGAIRLVDDEQLVREFAGLEIRAAPTGKVQIGRPKVRGMLDDSANAVALACAMAMAKPRSQSETTSHVRSTHPEPRGEAVAPGVRYHGDGRFTVRGEKFRDPRIA